MAEAPHIIAIAKEAAEANRHKEVTLTGHHPFLMGPAGVFDPSKFRIKPAEAQAVIRLTEVSSFIDYVTDHALPEQTVIFAQFTPERVQFMAIIDWHQRKDNAAQNGTHRALLTLETTPEWQAWLDKNEKLMPQEAFAEHIEEHATDIIKPDAAEILEMTQLLEGKKTATFKQGRRLKDGRVILSYVEDIELRQGEGVNRKTDDMNLPDKFRLGLVPFVGNAGIEIDAKLRFRIGNNGTVSFAYLLDRPHVIVREAALAAREQIETETKLRVHLGSV